MLSSADEFIEWRNWITRACSDTVPIDLSDPDDERPVGFEVAKAIYRTQAWIREIASHQLGPSKVFVVYGRNKKARDAMYAFLRAIDLEPLEWKEAVTLTGGGSPFVAEVLEAGFSAAQAVVVMLTGDDLAQLKPELLHPRDPDYERTATPQARPNVLFEAGFAFARHPKRTILVEFGRLRPFTDVQGRLVIRMDNSIAMRKELAERLRNAGCAVSLTGNAWHRAGTFDKLK
jgi:predicted nucleotide-binding protein